MFIEAHHAKLHSVGQNLPQRNGEFCSGLVGFFSSGFSVFWVVHLFGVAQHLRDYAAHALTDSNEEEMKLLQDIEAAALQVADARKLPVLVNSDRQEALRVLCELSTLRRSHHRHPAVVLSKLLLDKTLDSFAQPKPSDLCASFVHREDYFGSPFLQLHSMTLCVCPHLATVLRVIDEYQCVPELTTLHLRFDKHASRRHSATSLQDNRDLYFAIRDLFNETSQGCAVSKLQNLHITLETPAEWHVAQEERLDTLAQVLFDADLWCLLLDPSFEEQYDPVQAWEDQPAVVDYDPEQPELEPPPTKRRHPFHSRRPKLRSIMIQSDSEECHQIWAATAGLLVQQWDEANGDSEMVKNTMLHLMQLGRVNSLLCFCNTFHVCGIGSMIGRPTCSMCKL